ncbi:Iron binding protein SufA [Liberibacter crescens BT-1]|uniref:Iron binding protein SufA n=1 Tax=Liberibacter crescens (strain BT-1) TaxID=1215343 RepID=L0EWV4_LIBCB|nr:Fe-S cluster assembly scaffold SufA [Liberibacter crescens]AGA64861.1 Iron binding protein SufA [Liberibacter crescens BT-1]AMC12905.1 FeS assembly scaffold SufA [Liberibacter crescens]
MVSGNVITITDAAVSRVNEIVNNAEPSVQGIRIGIKKGGCAGLEYTINLVTTPDSKDDMVEKDGAKIWIDSSSLLYLIGLELDFEVTRLHSRFKFCNPNQISSCGCGDSVELKKAKLEEDIRN